MESKEILKRTLIIGLIIIILDQITKFLVIRFCSQSDMEIIKDIFYITQTKNIGVAFSLNSGNFKNIIISSIIIVFIIKYLFTQKKYLNLITLSCLDLVLAGGISNLVDRIFRGGVIDFIKISSFPIFNLADCAVVIGWALFAFYIIKVELGKNRRNEVAR